MPLASRFNSERILPISFSKQERFLKPIENGDLQLIMIESGCVSMHINHDRYYLQAGALIFRNSDTTITKLYSKSLKAESITFRPEFINVNLSADHIKEEHYERLRNKYKYPSFHLFFDSSNSYAGVLPLSNWVQTKALTLFEAAIYEMDSQPDDFWSCRTRINLLELFSLAEEEYAAFISEDEPDNHLAHKVLDYIHANYDKEITLNLLCEMFHTNHTSLLQDFKILTQTTISQYILDYRLQLAKEALLFTSLSIEEIAIKIGFHQASYLSRIFKSRMGNTPGQYRKQMVAHRKKKCGGFQNSGSLSSSAGGAKEFITEPWD